MKKIRLAMEKNIISLAMALMFISPVLLVKEESPIIFVYIILAAAIGWGFGREILFYFEGKRETKKFHPLLNDNALFTYLIIYILLAFVLSFYMVRTNLLLLFKILLGGILFFYGGLKCVQTGKIWLRGGYLEGKTAVFCGIIIIIFSLWILFYPLLERIGR